jgi:pyridoxamine 5'-phosphate oxidase family protein
MDPRVRLATVQPDGTVQVNPVGFRYNADDDTIDIGGRAMATTRKFRNVASNHRVAFVIDDVLSRQPWRVRYLEVRGTAEQVHTPAGPWPGTDGAIMRIHRRAARMISRPTCVEPVKGALSTPVWGAGRPPVCLERLNVIVTWRRAEGPQSPHRLGSGQLVERETPRRSSEPPRSCALCALFSVTGVVVDTLISGGAAIPRPEAPAGGFLRWSASNGVNRAPVRAVCR